MEVQVAIPEPSSDKDYNDRSLQPYLSALSEAGAKSVIVPIGARQETVARILAGTQAVLLPGSRYDVDPERYGAKRTAECGPSDPARTAIDELLLQDAFNLRKPILAICHGLQTMNVWLNGTLIQDLESEISTPVNHRPGREVEKAHPIAIAPGTRLARMAESAAVGLSTMCNSSHHQAIRQLGDRLRASAISPEDRVVEGVESDAADQFVIGVQWHPERTCSTDSFSREIFASFVGAAEAWRSKQEAFGGE